MVPNAEGSFDELSCLKDFDAGASTQRAAAKSALDGYERYWPIDVYIVNRGCI